MDEKVSELEGRLHLNSTNSRKPPSNDEPNNPAPSPRSLREKTGRKPGGQLGHLGHTLNRVEKPGHTQIHRLETYTCGRQAA